MYRSLSTLFFFYNDPATTEIYTLSLHDALPISTERESDDHAESLIDIVVLPVAACLTMLCCDERDRKSTRLNSSHITISYAVFCLKKKKKTKKTKKTK